MHYLRSYRFIFNHPAWGKNLLAASACQLVPILGQMVFTGYAFEILPFLSADDERGYPAFDINQLSGYLMRGLWPSVIQLLATLPVLFATWLIGFLLAALLTGDARGGMGPRLLLALLVPALFAVFLALLVVLVPVTLHVGARQEWSADILPYTRDFLGRVGRETVLAQLFVGLTGLALTVVGTALCCLPAFAALGVASFAWYHLLAQLQSLYLQRGGSAVAAKAA